ncbi:hypothetical protein K6V78_11575 [Streptococcus gallolyticus]|uniref:hypothetical protein n=1 Tax=Streptococcus hepaticus TaxID=3349163 RepID=UPI001C95D7D5|nr:hypothetical protein [Streptococcus gallolyticus]MBY5042229.1 hypothetical protein [Streptococcus gallolyticus]
MNRKLLVLMSSLLVATAGGATYFRIVKPTSYINGVKREGAVSLRQNDQLILRGQLLEIASLPPS